MKKVCAPYKKYMERAFAHTLS